MPDFTAHCHPVLAVRCPACQSTPGLWCRHPSGHRASDLHAKRGAEADRVFIEQHGWEASIKRDGDVGSSTREAAQASVHIRTGWPCSDGSMTPPLALARRG